MKKSELLAKYWAYGEDIQPVSEKEYSIMSENSDICEFDTMPNTVATTFIAHGYAYYAFTSQHYLGSKEADSFFFKLECGSGEYAILPE